MGLGGIQPGRKQAGWEQLAKKFKDAVVTPIRAIRRRYLPLLMIYFSYGALGLTAVAENFWVKKALTLTPAELAGLSVWLTLPWTVKMVFGQFVDAVPLLGSQRRTYVFLGAGLVAAGLIVLAGAAGGWLSFASLETLYVLASLLVVTGTVIQDVVADAMSTEVVDRTFEDGSARPDDDVKRDLGMVQVLGRLFLSFGIFAVAGISGWLASIWSYETVFLAGLLIPLISISGALLVRLETTERTAIDWRILGGGLAFGAFTTVLGVGGVPFAQEIVFLVSMSVVISMLWVITQDLDHTTRQRIFFAAVIIFVFRATPGVGEGYRWFSIDVLGFDEAFYGTLSQLGAALAMVGIWLLSDAITRKPVAWTLMWLTVAGTVLTLPNIALVYGVDKWTEAMFGFGARTIAIADVAIESPLAQLSMIPMLTLVAIHAPAGHRGTWFALMASLMNLALVAGRLSTKYLNEIFYVNRGAYDNLGVLVVLVSVIGLVVPLAAILAWGKRAE